MSLFRVSSRTYGSVDVEAPNWLGALGLAIARLKVRDPLDRIAAETLPNGTILARDARTGAGYIVVPIQSSESVIDERTEELAIDIDVAPDAGSPPSLGEELVAIARAATLDIAMATALDSAMAGTPAEAGSVLVRVGTNLKFAVSRGPGATLLTNVRIPSSVGVAGFCVNRGTALVLSDPYDDPRFFGEVDKITGVRTRSLLCVPLLSGGVTLGCIELLNAPEGFDTACLERARTLADALASRLAAG